jgi:hypothetical protein
VTRGTIDDGALGLGAAAGGVLGAGDDVGAGDVATEEGAPHATAANATRRRRDDCMDDPVLEGS